MKVLMINGSPKANACIGTALKIASEVFAENGIETETVHIGNKDIRGCIACLSCMKTGKCVFGDIVNETYAKLDEADGLIVGTPVYFGNPNGTVLSFLQRLFYSYPGNLKMIPAAAVISNRRGGSSASFEAMNAFFTMREMPVVSSSYWNDVHGYTAEDVHKDEEGVQTIRNLALNMAFMIKAIHAQKAIDGLPDTKKEAFTNMIRQEKNADYRTLNNGITMPMEGFEVFQVRGFETCKESVPDVIKAGHRLIDIAASCGNEDASGAV